MEFGKRLQEARTAAGLSQQALADKIGVTKATISNWELGKREPGFERLVLLAKTLNTKISTLLE